MKIKTLNREGLKISFVNEEEFELIYNQIFRKNEYPFATNARNPFILDCGSHIGLSILYFKKKYPAARIIAFEPNPFTFKLLRKNINQNKLHNVRLINAALFDNEKEIEFFIDKNKEKPWGWGDSAVINKWYNPKTTKIIRVNAIKLSSFITHTIDLLKLDIEGAEEKTLLEIKDKLNSVKEIMMEFHGSSTSPQNNHTSILSFLRENGFECKLKQDSRFIEESKIKKDDPYWGC